MGIDGRFGGGERGREVGGVSERQSCGDSEWKSLFLRLQRSFEDYYLMPIVCLFFLDRFAGLCRCTFWACSHRLTDLIQSPMDYSSSSRVIIQWRGGNGHNRKTAGGWERNKLIVSSERRRRQHLWEATHNFERHARTCGGTRMEGNAGMMGWPWQHEKEKVWRSIFIQSVIQHN